MTKPIHPAATVVTLKESDDSLQLLLLRRNPELVFAGNHWVFPGGKVEQAELDQANGILEHAFMHAAIRECHEETGLKVAIDSLVPISHWTTPDIRPKRFATQFYISLLNKPDKVIVDQSEIVEFKWFNASSALKEHQQGKLKLMPPTLVTLTEISKFNTFSELANYYQSREKRTYNPRFKMHSKEHQSVFYEGDSGYQDSNPDQCEQLNRCEIHNGIISHICNLDLVIV